MKSDEQYFADWEGHVFGYGYGSGEHYILPLLRTFLERCNGGANGQYDYEMLEGEMGGAVTWLLINTMAHANLIEYGSSPRFGWLTSTGQALRKFVLANDPDDLVRFTCRSEASEVCYPNACNCDGGYVDGRVCQNPFWLERAAQSYLDSAA